MTRLIRAALALVWAAGSVAYASTSAMTTTLTDTDGTVWANCQYTATLTVLDSPSTTPTISGVPVSPRVVNGSCNASGAISATLTDTSSVDQKSSQWVFQVQSNTSAAPATVTAAVTGASPNLTNQFSRLTAPRFAVGAGINAFGYTDAEVTNPAIGSSYFNTGTVCGGASFRQFSNAGWQCGGGASGGASFPASPGIVYSTSTTASQNATSAQIVAAANTSPSSTLAPALLPAATTTTAGSVQLANNFSTATVYGDSYYACAAVFDPGTQCAWSLLARDMPGAWTNPAVSGTTFSQIFQTFFTQWEPDSILPDLTLDGGGENDQVSCASATSPCGLALQYMYQAYLDWHGVPFTNRIMASASSGASGTWSNDTTLLTSFTQTASPGTPQIATVIGASKTFSLPANATSVRMAYRTSSAAGGSATLSVDGTLMTDGCSGTTSFAYQACSPTNPVAGTIQEYVQRFTLGAGTGGGGTHPVIVTVNATGNFELMWISYTTPGMVRNPTSIVNVQTTQSPYNTNALVWNQVAANAVAANTADGVWAWITDVVNGTPGVNTNADYQTSGSPGTTPTGSAWNPSTLGGHPGALGQYHMYQTILYYMGLNGLNASSFGQGGKTVDRTGDMREPFRFRYSQNGGGTIKQIYGSIAGPTSGWIPGLITSAPSDDPSDLSGLVANYRIPVSPDSPMANKFFQGFWQKGNNYNWCGVAQLTGTLNSAQSTAGLYVLPTGLGCIDTAGNGYFNYVVQPIGTAVASAATIAVSTPIVHITGTAAVSAITPTVTVCTKSGYSCTITLIPDGLFTLATGGTPSTTTFTFNNATVAVVGKPIVLTCDPAQQRCYASY